MNRYRRHAAAQKLRYEAPMHSDDAIYFISMPDAAPEDRGIASPAVKRMKSAISVGGRRKQNHENTIRKEYVKHMTANTNISSKEEPNKVGRLIDDYVHLLFNDDKPETDLSLTATVNCASLLVPDENINGVNDTDKILSFHRGGESTEILLQNSHPLVGDSSAEVTEVTWACPAPVVKASEEITLPAVGTDDMFILDTPQISEIILEAGEDPKVVEGTDVEDVDGVPESDESVQCAVANNNSSNDLNDESCGNHSYVLVQDSNSGSVIVQEGISSDPEVQLCTAQDEVETCITGDEGIEQGTDTDQYVIFKMEDKTILVPTDAYREYCEAQESGDVEKASDFMRQLEQAFTECSENVAEDSSGIGSAEENSSDDGHYHAHENEQVIHVDINATIHDTVLENSNEYTQFDVIKEIGSEVSL